MELSVKPDGTARCLYTENLDLHRLGNCRVKRASHVEPNAFGLWEADLTPVGGPVLGPFVNRSAALAAEVEWIERNIL